MEKKLNSDCSQCKAEKGFKGLVRNQCSSGKYMAKKRWKLVKNMLMAFKIDKGNSVSINVFKIKTFNLTE